MLEHVSKGSSRLISDFTGQNITDNVLTKREVIGPKSDPLQAFIEDIKLGELLISSLKAISLHIYEWKTLEHKF